MPPRNPFAAPDPPAPTRPRKPRNPFRGQHANRPRGGGGNQMPTFGSEADAAAAAKAGKIKPGDRITINGQTGTWQ